MRRTENMESYLLVMEALLNLDVNTAQRLAQQKQAEAMAPYVFESQLRQRPARSGSPRGN